MEKNTNNDVKLSTIVTAFFIFAIMSFPIFMKISAGDIGGSIGIAIMTGVAGVMITGAAIHGWKDISWRVRNGVDVFATLETDPETVKKKMFITMRFGHADGIKGALKELNEIFRNYPQWKLQDWVVFRSWYKHVIDQALRYPDVYKLKFKDGTSPYSKEQDPMYDSDAPDWEQFDRYYDDDDNGNDDNDDNDDVFDNDDDENFDDSDDSAGKFRKAAEDGFYTGLGIGAAGDMLNK